MKYEIVPGILEKSQPELQKKFTTVAKFANIIQIDIIDEKFATTPVNPDLSFTQNFPNQLELHLMTETPEDWIDSYQGLNIKRIAAHLEFMPNPTKFINKLKEKNIDPYLAIDLPTTPDNRLSEFVAKGLKGVLVMTVKAGKSGQSFQPKALEKVQQIRQKHPEINIEIDGGVSRKIIPQALNAGANIFAVTSSIFKKGDPYKNFQTLKKSLP